MSGLRALHPRRAGHARTAEPDLLQLSESVVQMPDSSTSMRFLEFTIASVAIVAAILLGFAH